MAAIEELTALLNQLEQALHEYYSTALKTFDAWTSVGGAVPSQLIALDRTSPDGKRMSVALKLQADMESPLVRILPDTAHPNGLRCFAIEDSTDNFCWGTFRFITATGKVLLVRNDKVTKSLPEACKAMDINPGRSARNMGSELIAG